jgi:hypothetical protein
VRKVPFASDDASVLIIDPGFDVNDIFGDVDLPCNTARRLNNTLNAPILQELTQEFRN